MTSTLGRFLVSASLSALLAGAAPGSDWPTVRGNPRRDGRTEDCVEPPYAKAWARWWPGESMATRVEAIVAEGRVFVGTQAGRLHALDAASGEDIWTFEADGPILHSPVCSEGAVFCATASPGRTVYRLAAADGRVAFAARGGPGGFSASPLVFEGRVLIGGRDGVFRALDAATGAVVWTYQAGGPIRTTAAAAEGRVFCASEDLRAWALDASTGRLLWKSETLEGQSLRDYYPVLIGPFAIYRTNPVEQMGVHLSRTYSLVGRAAGIDLSSWQNVDAYVKSGKTRGSPELFEREQRAVLAYLEERPPARTFYALDRATGREALRAPVLWGAGCQGIGVPPVSVGGSEAIVFTRTAYGNWTLGVAPLVGLQRIDFAAEPRPVEAGLGPLPTARASPLFHTRGDQPPWNTFWGTADETTNYSAGGRLLYACHQGTVGAYDLRRGDLFPVAGARDTWGGEPGLPWARNEWHGPARGSLAISGDSLYWVTGSRVIAIRGSRSSEGFPRARSPAAAPAAGARPSAEAAIALEPPAGPPPPLPSEEAILERLLERPVATGVDRARVADLARELERRVEEVLDAPRLAPLFVEIGLGSHDFFFKTSAETVAALALAYPWVGEELQPRILERCREEFSRHPLSGPESRYPLDGPERREPYRVPKDRFYLGWESPEDLPEAWALDLYGARTGDWGAVEKLWPRVQRAFEAFRAKGWTLDAERGERFANARIAGLIGAARLARRFGEPAIAAEAARLAAAAVRKLSEHWRAGASAARVLRRLEGVAELDRFIGRGDPLYFAIVPHRHKIAKFLDLTPEVGRALREALGPDAAVYLELVDRVLPTWYLAWEERQVHFGENWIDFPDQALAIFRAKRFIGAEGRESLERWIDLPWCRADLYHVEKLALAIEASGATEWRGD